jgi:hypothetical protein
VLSQRCTRGPTREACGAQPSGSRERGVRPADLVAKQRAGWGLKPWTPPGGDGAEARKNGFQCPGSGRQGRLGAAAFAGGCGQRCWPANMQGPDPTALWRAGMPGQAAARLLTANGPGDAANAGTQQEGPREQRRGHLNYHACRRTRRGGGRVCLGSTPPPQMQNVGHGVQAGAGRVMCVFGGRQSAHEGGAC